MKETEKLCPTCGAIYTGKTCTECGYIERDTDTPANNATLNGIED